MIVGCGRVGAELADVLDRAGHDVIVVDTLTRAFDRLPGTFGGSAVRGDGTDEDTLRRAGAEHADLFLAMTEGDNRNVMAAQLAVEALGAKQVIAKINDPLRAAAYADLGLAALCRTTLMADAVRTFLGLPTSGVPGIQLPTGVHPGGEHHDLTAAGGVGGARGDGATARGSTAAFGGPGSSRAPAMPEQEA
ncbi:MAG TPA: TrkA family potassium uptake protein [Candidatus Limnocylindrales bacterium]